MKRIRLFLVLLVTVETMPGCRTTEPHESTAFAAIVRKSTGMVGVVPPREDVRAGDVFLYGDDAEGGALPKPITATPLWSSLPVRELVHRRVVEPREQFNDLIALFIDHGPGDRRVHGDVVVIQLREQAIR